MITGDRSLAQGKRGAFYNTLEEFHKYWECVDIICPRVKREKLKVKSLFGNVFIHPSPWPLFLQPFWIIKKGLKIYKEQKFDLMTVHSYPPFYNDIGAKMLWKKIKVPYILEIHHIPGHPKPADVKEKIYKTLFKFFIRFSTRKAKAVRIVNQKQVPEFLVKSGVSREKIIYIPSMYVDLEIFQPMNLPKEYDFIFVGRLEKNKGTDLLLEAVSKLKTQILNFKIIIIGAGSLENNLKFKIENLKLQDNILLYGWAKDSREIAELMNKSRILVMPSYNEGGPRVVLEAMACGLPVLATPVGIVPDIIESGESGEIINWSAKDIAQKLQILLNDKNGQEKYKNAGIKIASRFEKKLMIQNYADKLKNLTSL